MRQLGFCAQCGKQSVQEGAMCDECKAADLAALRAYAEQDNAAPPRSQLAAAVAALESIANDPGYKMSQALNETHLWEMTAKRRQQMARQALKEIRGDDGNKTRH